MKYALLVCIIVSISCSRNNDSTPANNKYFFDCTVDGRKLHIEGKEIISTITNNLFSGQVNSQIAFMTGTNYCSQPGTTCFQQVCYIQAQSTGIYSPATFVIEITEGQTKINYAASSIGTSRGNMKVTVSKIARSSTLGTFGIMEGSFTGTIIKIVGIGTEIPVNINGSFRVPLSQ